MKLFLSTSLLALTCSVAFAADCPTVTGPDAGGAYPHLFEKAEFEAANSCELTFQDNPEIAALNARIAGNPADLPGVADRLPAEPLVIAPYAEIGTYGGVFDGISKATEAGTSDLLSVRHVNLTRYNDDLTQIVPNVAKSFAFNEDFTELKVELREGHKWSDGEPFTAEDVKFWYDNLVMDTNVTAKPKDRFLSGGEPWQIEVTSPTELTITLAAPTPGLLSMFATDYAQPFQPKHVIGQFHPAVNADADALAQSLGFANGYEAVIHYYGQSDWKDIPTPINKSVDQTAAMVEAGYPATAPTLESFIVIEDSVEGRRLVANPYFFQIDTAGNQLPYINEIKEVFIGDEDIQTAKLIAGEVDYKAQAVNLPSAPVLLENREKGDYAIALRPNVGMMTITFNATDKNEVLREVFNDVRFRQAASHALDRNKINEIAFLNLGQPSQFTAFDADTSPFVTEEQRTAFTEFDPAKSAALLDEMGLTDSDGDGVRELPNGEKFELVFQFSTQGISTEVVEIVSNNLTDIGIKVTMKEVTSDEYRSTQSANGLSIGAWTSGQPLAVMSNDVSTLKPPFGNFFSLRNGMLWSQYIDSDGAEGVMPPAVFTEIGEMADQFTQLEAGSDASNELGTQIVDKWLDQLLMIGTVKGVSPIYVSNGLGNFATPKTSSYEYYRVYPYIPTQWFLKQ
ncbi:MAG: peptide ABC transporter substrate-binding protein [Rhodobacterales bacterium]|nr:MAG: peptide ABC transporter substrate-binding protein [Rhodobacterales bacterium]